MITGTRYGKLTLIEVLEPRGKRKFGNFKCDCGTEKAMRLDNVKSQENPSCGCGRRKIPSPGQKFNRLTFVEYIGLGSPRTNGTVSTIGTFKCDCGTIKTYQITWVTKGIVKGCGCMRQLEAGKAAENKVFRNYKNHAKRRKLAFNLTIDQFVQLTNNNCHYCGTTPTNVCKAAGGDFLYNGVDRLDNHTGYTIANCVPCCNWCNHAKATISSDDFIAMCKRVASFQSSPLQPPLQTS